jgi:hypothetical protein
MPDDQDQSQSGGGIGGALSAVGKGITKALPYALDIGLGAALGGPVGAAAGLARGMGTSEEKSRQQELGMQQQDLGLRIEQFGLEKQKMMGALQSEQNYQGWVDSQPKDDQAMLRAVPPEARGKVITQKIQTGDWQHSLEMMKDPEFLKAHNLTTADVSVLQGLPAEMGNKLFPEMLKAGQQNNLQAMKFVQQQALEAQRESAAAGRQASSEAAAAGRQATSEAAQDARQKRELQSKTDKATKAPSPSMLSNLATKAKNDAEAATKTGYFGTTIGASDADRKAAAMANFTNQLISNGMDPDKASELAERYVAPKYSLAKKPAGAGAAPAQLPVAPKALWGKTVTKDGKQYTIDSMGRATPL